MVMINFLSIPFLLSIYLFFNKILLEIIAANMNKNPTINVKLIPKKSPLELIRVLKLYLKIQNKLHLL